MIVNWVNEGGSGVPSFCPAMRCLVLLELMWMSGRNVTDAVQWITETEPQLTSEDYGKDLVSAEALLHNHRELMKTIQVMDDRVSHCWRKGRSLGLEEAFGGHFASKGCSKFTTLMKEKFCGL